MEKIAGSKDVAPSHFAAIRDDNTYNALALKSRSSARETPLHLIHEAVH